MTATVHYNSQSHFFLSKNRFFQHPFVKTTTLHQSFNLAVKAPVFDSRLSVSRRPHVSQPVICGRRNKRRSGYQRSGKFILQLLSALATNAKVLPQPLDLVVAELGGGDGGGGIGFLKGVGGGGGYGNWRRGKGLNLWLLVVLVWFGFLMFVLLSKREVKSDVVVIYGVVGLCMVFLKAVLVKGLKRNAKDSIFGVCCFGVLMGLVLKRKETVKLINDFRVYCTPIVDIVRGRKKRRRRRALF